MIGERIELWHKEEYHYPAAHGFIPIMVSYIHEDELMHPAMLVVRVAVTDLCLRRKLHPVAMEFYQAGYNVFVLEYTVNPLDEAPLKLQPLKDISSNANDPFSCRTAAYFIGSDRGLWIFSRRTSVCESVCAWSGYRGSG